MPFLAVIAPTFLFFSIALVAFIISAIKKSTRAVEGAWQEAAERMKLTYQPKRGMSGKRKLEGPYRGYSVRINTFTQSHGNGSSVYTRYTLFMPPLQLGLDLTQQHFLSGLTNSLKGGQDLTVGDDDFDRAVIVKSTAPHAMKDFLTPDRRMQIRKFLTGARRAKITDDELTYIHNGVTKKAEDLRLGANKLVSLADALQASGSRDSMQAREREFRAVAEAEEAQQDRAAGLRRSLEAESNQEFFNEEPIMSTMGVEPPPLPEAAPVPPVPEVRDPNAPPSFPWQNPVEVVEPVKSAEIAPPAEPVEPIEIVEPEPTFDAPVAPTPPIAHFDKPLAAAPEASAEPAREMGQQSAPASLFDQNVEPVPSEPVAFAAPAEVAAQEEVAVEPTSDIDSVDYLNLRSELFDTSMMSSQAKEHFDANYAGRAVQWTGKLRRISGYSSDFVFKGSTGSKAIIELEGIPDGSFTKGVQAVVQLPAEAATEFANRYDIEVEFTGQLHSCDGFLRDIFVDAGSMTAK